jgi:hypothetical protein
MATIAPEATSPTMTKIEAKKVAANLGLEGKTPAIPVGEKPLGLVTTIKESPKTTQPLKETIAGMYDIAHNPETISAAQKRIATDPNGAYQYAVGSHGPEQNATAVLLAKQYEAAGQGDMAANLMTLKTTQALEAGQGNQIYAMWNKLSPETVGMTASKIIEQAKAKGAKIPSLTADQYQGFVDQAKTIQGITDPRQKGIATQDLLTSIGRLIPSSTLDKTVNLWRTGLLTGLRTIGKVVISHAAFGTAGMEQAKNIPATGVDVLASLFTGKRSMTPTLRGTVGGFTQGVNDAVDNLVHGYNAPNSGGFSKDFTNQVNYGDSLFGKVAQAYVDTIGRIHGSLYKPFFGSAHMNALYDQALTEAGNQGLKGVEKDNFVLNFVKNPPDKAQQVALATGEYAAFQNKTQLGSLASNVAKTAGGLGRFAVPFTQIPSSIAMKLFDYSPIGAVKTIIQNIGEGNFNQRDLSMGLGRAITGTAVYVVGAALAAAGKLALDYPKTPSEQAIWKAQGKNSDMVNIGGKWRTLSSLGPLGDMILVGGHFYEGLKAGGFLQGVGQAAMGGASVLANLPYIQELNAISQGIQDPQNKALGAVKSFASSIVPTIVGNIATATDPYQRQTANPIVNSITNKIPGFREKSLPQQDMFGNPIPRAEGPIGTMIDPFYSSTARTTPILDELQRLQTAGSPVALEPMTKNQTILKQKVTLTPQQLNDLNTGSGGQLQPTIQALISSPAYQGLGDDEKAKSINNVIQDMRTKYKNLNAASITAPTGTGTTITPTTMGTKNLIPIVQTDGTMKMIDPTFQPSPPKLTGSTELDKKIVSQFDGEITSKANDIYALYKASTDGTIKQGEPGYMTADDANTQLSALKDLKASYAAGKTPAKISISNPYKKMPFVTMAKSNVTNFKVPALPKLKKTTGKAIKITNLKPTKFAKLKGLTGSRKLV